MESIGAAVIPIELPRQRSAEFDYLAPDMPRAEQGNVSGGAQKYFQQDVDQPATALPATPAQRKGFQ